MTDDADILARALDDFAECEERERENRSAAEDDIRFARLEEQWPEGVRRQRLSESRPCLVVNKLPTFIRQVVNDSRLNKPSIRVAPQDSVADPATADRVRRAAKGIWVLKARQFDQVPPQLMRFVNAGGRVVRGLVNRRAAECALWHEVDEAEGTEPPQTPPSSVTRAAPTPPTPADNKPLVQSKSFTTAAATGVTAAAVAVGEVSRAVSPYAAQSQIVERAVAALALTAAALAVAALVFAWLKRRGAAR